LTRYLPQSGIDKGKYDDTASSFSLYSNYPNPFNQSTTITFSVPSSCTAAVSVYNALGRKVRDIFSGPIETGIHRFVWDGHDYRGALLSSGIYVIVLKDEMGEIKIRKAVLNR